MRQGDRTVRRDRGGMGAAVRVWAVLALGALACPAAMAQTGRSGEQVYSEVCAACHATGLNKAPRFGDKAKWAPLIREKQYELTAHAWVGVRGMPARGGRPDLTLEEFSAAVVHMARAGGATWKDPDAAMLERIRAEEKKRLEKMKAKK